MSCGVRVSLSQASVLHGTKCEGICESARTRCPRYTILSIQNAIDRFYERQSSALEQAAAQQQAQHQAEKSGVEFVPPDKEQSA